MPIIRRTFSVGLLGCNCSILAAEGSRRAIVVDPGGEAERIVSLLHRQGLELSDIVITHGHVDHVLAAGELKRMTGAAISLHPDDRFLWDDLAMQGRWMGLELRNDLPAPDRDLADGDRIECEKLALEVLHTPGHTPGSLSFRVAGESLVLAGDTLFARSIGRTDLPGGSWERIEDSIRSRLYTLPGETVVVCGHGPETTIGEEIEENPFVAGR
jgi:glyoxylase-like metal-dependent hydrolase (beta-lactamase superfamily II)